MNFYLEHKAFKRCLFFLLVCIYSSITVADIYRYSPIKVGDGWRDIHATASERISVKKLSRILSKRVTLFEVLPGDKVSNWAGERSELAWMVDNAGKSLFVDSETPPEYYLVEVKLDKNWIAPGVDGNGYRWGIFFQLHGPDDYNASPTIAFTAEDKFGLNICAGEISGFDNKIYPKGPIKYTLSESDLLLGRWVAFVLKVKWSIDNNGYLQIYRRNEGDKMWRLVLDLNNISTLQARGGISGKHYWKTGIYRSASNFPNRLSIGNIVRGKSISDVSGDFWF